MSKTKTRLEFWSVLYTHKHGTDSWTVEAKSAEDAMEAAVRQINSEMPDNPFDPDRENLDVSPFKPPVGFVLMPEDTPDILNGAYTQIKDLSGGWPVKELFEPPKKTLGRIEKALEKIGQEVDD